MVFYLRIAAHDPLIARDGRPFSLGIRMKSLDWFYPSVFAGSVRTMLGKAQKSNFGEAAIEALKSVSISGPLPCWQGNIYLPAPMDILVKEENKIRDNYAYAVRPINLDSAYWNGCNCDIPASGLLPAMLPSSVEGEFKPAKTPSLWSMDMMKKWLINARGESFISPPDPEKIKDDVNFLSLPEREARTHVMIDPELGNSKESNLFETIGLDFSVKGRDDGVEMVGRVENEGQFKDSKMDPFITIGGERRLARLKAQETQEGWGFPLDLASKFSGKLKVRMVLATPAIFSDGWLPGWLNGWKDDKKIPDYWPKGLRLKLVSACIDSWKPISGWSLEKGKRKPGPKPIRRLVPAGSVYFFEVLEGDAAAMAESLWLKSVCDDLQDRRDGFGLALWGIWDYADENDANRQE